LLRSNPYRTREAPHADFTLAPRPPFTLQRLQFPAKGHLKYNTDVRQGPVHIQFFAGGTTNLSYNCLDRWVAAGRGDCPALLYEGNDESERRTVSYRQLLDDVCRLSNWLLAAGVKRGDGEPRSRVGG
jgi:hypothetical protein